MYVETDVIYKPSTSKTVVSNRFKWLLFVLVNLPLLARSQSIVPDPRERGPPIANTKYGKVKGTYFETVNNNYLCAFEGIPYATPPLGGLRFMPPVEPEPWNGTWKATWPGPECLQMSLTKLNRRGSVKIGREDCLYLDVYTPFPRSASAANPLFYTKRPVVVNFHGGPFTVEYYQPYILTDYMPVVFVHVNYRVGPFGFLTMESSKYPGNMGMKDQVMALKWVKENIINFNGDPDRVTLLGWSAGAASVHYHYLSKQSQNLFEKGISMSGSALCPWALMERGKEKAYRLAEAVGCNVRDDDTVVECLRRVNTKVILSAVQDTFMPWLYNPFSPFGPTIEKPFDESDGPVPDAFLDDHPYDIIRNGRAKVAPWLVSVAASDGLFPGGHFITNESCLHELSYNWVDIAPHLLDFNFTVHYQRFKPRIARTIKRLYTKDVINDYTCNFTRPEVQNHIIELLSDRLFKSGIGLAANLHAKLNSSVYFYVFKYRGENSVSKFATNTNEDFGACHGDDLIYTLGAFYRGEDLSQQDERMVEKMTDYWGNFIFKGKPSDAWEAVYARKDFGALNYLDIASPEESINVVDNDFGRINFWMTVNIDELLFWKKNRFFTDSYENEPDPNEGMPQFDKAQHNKYN